MSATAMVTGGPDSGATTHVPASQDTSVPSTSVIAGPPDGPVSPVHHPAYDDPLPDDMRAQAVGGSGRGHAGILGFRSTEQRIPFRRTW